MASLKSVCLAVLVFCCLTSLAAADDDGPELVATPRSVFFRQPGTTPPAPVQVAVSAKGGTLGAFSAAASTKSGGNWLTVSPTSGSGPGNITISVDTTNLKPGEYSGKIILSATGFSSEEVEVELELGSAGDDDHEDAAKLFSVRPHELEFHTAAGGPSPKGRQVEITSGTASFNWTAAASVTSPAGGTWLKVSPASGTGPGVLQVDVDITGLASGKYKGQITVTSGQTQAKVEVELELEGAETARLKIGPRAFEFTVEPNSTQPPKPKTLEVESAPSGVTTWTAEAIVDSPPGGKWLSVDPVSGTVPGKTTVKVDPTGLAAGMYSGKIKVTAGSQTAEARVFLRLLAPGKPKVVVTPKALKFNATGGTASPASRTIKIRSNASGLNYTATATTAKGGNWLILSSASGAVPGTVGVSANAAGLDPGVYTGNVEIKVPGAAQEVHNVMVALKVHAPEDKPHLEVEPGAVAFSAVKGGAAPAAQKVKLEPEDIASLDWTASVSTASGGNWLSVTPTSGTTTPAANSELSISVNISGLDVGTYTGTVLVTPAASSGVPPVTVSVKLVVSAASNASKDGMPPRADAAAAGGSLLAFFTQPSERFITQTDLPQNVTVMVLDSLGAPVEGATLVVHSSRTEPDLVLTDAGGGEYSGVFRPLSSGVLTLSGTAQRNSQLSPAFAVSGDMEAGRGTPAILFQNGAVSAASFAPGPTPLAPGSLVSLFGQGIAGNGGEAAAFPLPARLGGVSVTIGGFVAPLLAAVRGTTTDQINLQVPFELEGVAQADIVVNNNGVLGVPETVTIGAAPALFTLSGTGSGPGAFLHADFSLVGASHPAVPGETILLYATGLGALTSPVKTGAAPSGAVTVAGKVIVTIGGQPAVVQYAGVAPRFAGLYQVNVVVPAGVSGEAPVELAVDGLTATGRATVATR